MSTLTPHVECLQWQPGLSWPTAISETVLGCASLALAVILTIFMLRRHADMLRVFVALIGALAIFAAVGAVSCLLSVVTMWVPVHGIEVDVKAFLALVAAIISGALLIGLPRLLVISRRVQLQHAYAALEEE